jgi:hypothetical protein
MATGYGLDSQGVRVQVLARARFFSSVHHPDQLWGTPSLLSNGYLGLSLGVKLLGYEADHSPTTTADVKNTWIYTSTSSYIFMV